MSFDVYRLEFRSWAKHMTIGGEWHAVARRSRGSACRRALIGPVFCESMLTRRYAS